MEQSGTNLLGSDRSYVFEKQKLNKLLENNKRYIVGKFKYFNIGYNKPHSNIKSFHQFCIAYSYYFKGYTDSYGYKCPNCFGNGHSLCKICKGSTKIFDRSPIIKQYITYRREFRAALEYWKYLREIWENTVDALSDEQQEALEIFGRRQ